VSWVGVKSRRREAEAQASGIVLLFWADPHGRRQFGKRDELTLNLYMRRVGAQFERLGAEKKRHP
jgi:hypothetical protein